VSSKNQYLYVRVSKRCTRTHGP